VIKRDDDGELGTSKRSRTNLVGGDTGGRGGFNGGGRLGR